LTLLKRYQTNHGHVKVPSDYLDAKTKYPLGQWLARILAQPKSALSRRQVSDLESCGVVWPPATWEEWFDLLVKFGTEHGHTSPARDQVYQTVALGEWAAAQRDAYWRTGLSVTTDGTSASTSTTASTTATATTTLSDDQVARLQEIGFRWRLSRSTTMNKATKTTTGEPKTTATASKTSHNRNQPKYKECSTATKEMKVPSPKKLPAKSTASNKSKAPIQTTAPAKTPATTKTSPTKSSCTTTGARAGKAQRQPPPAKLSKQPREKCLERVKKPMTWEEWFQLLKTYKKEKKHVSPTNKEVFCHQRIGGWVSNQRQAYSRYLRGITNTSSKMTKERISLLSSIGFVWRCRDKLQLGDDGEQQVNDDDDDNNDNAILAMEEAPQLSSSETDADNEEEQTNNNNNKLAGKTPSKKPNAVRAGTKGTKKPPAKKRSLGDASSSSSSSSSSLDSNNTATEFPSRNYKRKKVLDSSICQGDKRAHTATSSNSFAGSQTQSKPTIQDSNRDICSNESPAVCYLNHPCCNRELPEEFRHVPTTDNTGIQTIDFETMLPPTYGNDIPVGEVFTTMKGPEPTFSENDSRMAAMLVGMRPVVAAEIESPSFEGLAPSISMEDIEMTTIGASETSIVTVDDSAPSTSSPDEQPERLHSTASGAWATAMSWETILEMLERYKNEHGNLKISPEDVDSETGWFLGEWYHSLGKESLTPDKVAELKSVGFAWPIKKGTKRGNSKPQKMSWEAWFDLLVQFKQFYGHAGPRDSKVFRGKNLGRWASNQRNAYSRQKRGKVGKNSSIPPNRVSRLNDLGFVWRLGKATGKTTSQLEAEPSTEEESICRARIAQTFPSYAPESADDNKSTVSSNTETTATTALSLDGTTQPKTTEGSFAASCVPNVSAVLQGLAVGALSELKGNHEQREQLTGSARTESACAMAGAPITPETLPLFLRAATFEQRNVAETIDAMGISPSPTVLENSFLQRSSAFNQADSTLPQFAATIERQGLVALNDGTKLDGNVYGYGGIPMTGTGANDLLLALKSNAAKMGLPPAISSQSILSLLKSKLAQTTCRNPCFGSQQALAPSFH